MFDRIPPSVPEIEAAVLGVFMLEESALQYADQLTPEHFLEPNHKHVFNAIRAILESGAFPDMVTIESYLRNRNIVVDTSSLTNYVSSIANIEYHIAILKEKLIARKVITHCSTLLSEAYNPVSDGFELAERMEREAIGIFSATDSGKVIGLQTASEIYREMVNTPDVGRLHTGHPFYDNVYYSKGGSRRGQLEYVLAITGHGKTQYLAYMCAMYAKRGYNIEWFQFEDSKYSTVELFLPYGEEVLSRVFITDECRTVQQVESVLRRRKQQHDIVVVDYIQAVNSAGTKDVRERVSSVSEKLRSFAKDFNCYVIGASQVSRDKLRSGYKAFPTLQDAKESSQIEQDAFVVTSVFRPVMVEELRNGNGTVKGIHGDEMIPDSALYVRNLKNRKQKVNYTPRLLHHTEFGLSDVEIEVPVQPKKKEWYLKEDDLPF